MASFEVTTWDDTIEEEEEEEEEEEDEAGSPEGEEDEVKGRRKSSGPGTQLAAYHQTGGQSRCISSLF